MNFYSEHIENNNRPDQLIGLETREEQQCPPVPQFLKIKT